MNERSVVARPSFRSVLKMRIQNHLFGLIFAFSVESSLTSSCKDIASNSPNLRLIRYLFCDYDKSVRPSENHKNATFVSFRLIVQSIDFHDVNNALYLESWYWFTWADQHLKWDPSDFDDIEWIDIPSNRIWTPDFTVHSVVDFEQGDDMPLSTCWIHHSGIVYCIPSTVDSAHCVADHKWWPYDTMNCTIQFGSQSYSNDEVQLHVMNWVSLDVYQENLEFDITSVTTSGSTQTTRFQGFDTKIVSYHFFIRRHLSLYSVAYLVPAIALMIMTLMILWLQTKSMERMIIGNLSFVLHLLCIQNLHSIIPPNGSESPRLLLFYEASFQLTTFSIILTSILRHVNELKIGAPSWISTNTGLILRSRIGQILLVSVLDPKTLVTIELDADDNTDLVSPNKKASSWEYVTIIIGWLAFFGVLSIYIVLLAAYFPTSNSGNYVRNL